MTMQIYVRGILFDEEGRVLFVRKNDRQVIGAGLWILPGGTVQFGETATGALRRELLEEVGFEAATLTLVGEDMRLIEDTHWQGLIFLGHGNVRNVCNREPDKHDGIDWKDSALAKAIFSENECRAFDRAFALRSGLHPH